MVGVNLSKDLLYRKLLFFRWKSKKTSFFGLAFFRVYNFFGLDKYFPDFLCKKFNFPTKNTLRDFRGPGMTHTPEKLRWIFIQFLVIYYIKYEAKNVNRRSWCTPLRRGQLFKQQKIPFPLQWKNICWYEPTKSYF